MPQLHDYHEEGHVGIKGISDCYYLHRKKNGVDTYHNTELHDPNAEGCPGDEDITLLVST